ncbi:ribosomal protein P0 [Capsaspora owczarzaki ATCC 30864]|uniref:60S acidic ribosomal protein P0 n=1 Tax=Capsaspora owczarzaki (strain ATCC 30864) TaxID=595528 RepID=A0A0D2VUN1_CAPO3|nr:ribosomal protein P0 [Capsaspora owczarzaki ATCC 30864]KJE95077.1 ribosomal protein P0 [Capsaspora owczarzaki ATCC 30864]|eukprot:XP_004346242.1 ribosomal protein P0 [Capsaspora owczarzaki ATCC 30864]
MSKADGDQRKTDYFTKLVQLLQEYPRLFIVGVDNVGSNQMQQIRMSLRGRGVILMGKNTMIRKAIRGHVAANPAVEKLLPFIRENVGFVFTKDDLSQVRTIITANRVAAPAKAGALAPVDVFVPAGNTGLGPEKTSFFQALSIPTKIARGTIEIVSDVHLIKSGDKVDASAAALLNMLAISPFSYGLVIRNVYDNGAVFSPEVLDITQDDLLSKFTLGVRNVAAVSLAIDFPTVASVPHSIVNAYKNVLAVVAEIDYTFKQAEKLKAYLANPSAFAAAAAPVAVAAKTEAKKEEPKKEEKKEESEEGDMGFGLFD